MVSLFPCSSGNAYIGRKTIDISKDLVFHLEDDDASYPTVVRYLLRERTFRLSEDKNEQSNSKPTLDDSHQTSLLS